MKKRVVHRLFICAFLLIFVCSIFPAAASVQAASFSDISGHWAQDDIEYMTDKDIIYGYSDGTFRPDNYVSRAEYIAMTNRTYKLRSGSSATNFKDVNSSDWFAREVSYAVAAGYISGYPDGTFRPNQYITRQEVAVTLARLLDLKPSNTSKTLKAFRDGEAIPSWARESVAALAERGYLKGDANGYLQGSRAISRAEITSLLKRLMRLSPAEPGETPRYINSAGVYGPSSGTEIIAGDLTINASGVSLRNTHIRGDLLISSGVGNGTVKLNAVQVDGTLTIKGGGENSISLTDCSLSSVLIDKKDVRVTADGKTRISKTILKSGAVLQETTSRSDGFTTVEVSESVPKDSCITLEGSYAKLIINASNIRIDLPRGSTIINLEVNKPCKITGTGEIEKASIYSSGVSISQQPDNIYITPGLTATVNGKTVTNRQDTTPPRNIVGYPQIDDVSSQSFDILIKTNEDGHAYYVVLPQTAAAPSSAQVKAGEDSSGSTVASKMRGKIYLNANSVATATVSGLNPATTYKVYVAVEDTSDNLQASPVRLTVSTTKTRAPIFVTGYPTTANVGSKSLDLLVKTDKDGRAYFVVLENGAYAPSSSQVKAGKNASGRTVASNLYGSIRLNAYTTASISISGLEAAVNYDIYVAAEDTSLNLQSSPAKIDVKTSSAADTKAPVFSSGYPLTTNVGPNSFTLQVKTNENGKAYYVVLPQNTKAPSSAQVKAGKNGLGITVDPKLRGSLPMTANKVAAASVNGLSPETEYSIYVAAEDAVPNLQTSPARIELKTSPLDTAPPAFSSGYPCIDSIALNSFDLYVQINEDGKAFYLVLDDNAPAPGSEQVKAGQDADGTSLPAGRQGAIRLNAKAQATARVTGLNPAASYDVYVVAEDNASNLQESPVKLDVSTLADVTAPTWTEGYPQVRNAGPGIIKLLMQIDEAGQAYYVVLANGSAAPSPAQVKAGQDDSGNNAIASDSIHLEAKTAAETIIPGLDLDTDYVIYLIAEDKVPNLQKDVTQLTVKTSP